MPGTTVNDEIREIRQRFKDPGKFARMITIMDKWGTLRPLIHNTAQQRFFQDYSLGRPGMSDWLVKTRQIGMTTGVVAECLRLAFGRPRRLLTMLDKADNTQVVRELLDRALTTFPILRLSNGEDYPPPHRLTDNVSTMLFSNGSRWRTATAGSKGAGRSQTVDVWHTSETAHYDNAKDVMTGAGEAAAQAIWRVHESTANGATGYFYDVVNRALRRPNGLDIVHFFPWWWSPEYRTPIPPGVTLDLEPHEWKLMETYGLDLDQLYWRRLKIEALGPLFDQEYPEAVETAFVRSGFGYFGDLSGVWTAPRNPVYNPDHTYVGGLDFGQMHDFTVLMVGDATTGEQVDRVRVRRQSWSDMRALILDKFAHWSVSVCRVEANSMGTSQIEALRTEIAQRQLTTSLWSFVMTAATQPRLFQTYRTGLVEKGLALLDDPITRAEHNAVRAKQTVRGWTVDLPKTQTEGAEQSDDQVTGHGDTVVAAALMYLAMTGIGIAGGQVDVA